MTRWVTATLVKLRTDDGLVEMHDNIPLGKTYEVDLDSIATHELFNLVHHRHTKESITARDGGRIPTEMLDIPDPPYRRCPICGGPNPGDITHTRCM